MVGTIPHRSPQPDPILLSRISASDPAPAYQDVVTASSSAQLVPPPSYVECIEDGTQVDLIEAGDVSDSSSLYGQTTFVPLYRYVTEYQYQAPPAYSEFDPFPCQE